MTFLTHILLSGLRYGKDFFDTKFAISLQYILTTLMALCTHLKRRNEKMSIKGNVRKSRC